MCRIVEMTTHKHKPPGFALAPIQTASLLRTAFFYGVWTRKYEYRMEVAK